METAGGVKVSFLKLALRVILPLPLRLPPSFASPFGTCNAFDEDTFSEDLDFASSMLEWLVDPAE